MNGTQGSDNNIVSMADAFPVGFGAMMEQQQGAPGPTSPGHHSVRHTVPQDSPQPALGSLPGPLGPEVAPMSTVLERAKAVAPAPLSAEEINPIAAAAAVQETAQERKKSRRITVIGVTTCLLTIIAALAVVIQGWIISKYQPVKKFDIEFTSGRVEEFGWLRNAGFRWSDKTYKIENTVTTPLDGVPSYDIQVFADVDGKRYKRLPNGNWTQVNP